MRVLFISRKKSDGAASIIIRNQAYSLMKMGIDIDFFMIEKGGIKGYLKAIPALKKHLRSQPSYDIIHAHYSFTAFVVSMVRRRGLVVSLMGSDVKAKAYNRLFIRLFNRLFWRICIVKSEDMKKASGVNNAIVIPNGVDFKKFKPIDQTEAQKHLGFDKEKKHLLFAADPARPEKNYKLAEAAVNLLNDKSIVMHYVKDIPCEMMVYQYNAADIVLLTSLWEGSPNVIKEACACNRPLVTTDVGDVREYLPKVKYCYISSYDAGDIASKIKALLKKPYSTNGRDIIKFLDEDVIAKKIINIYQNVIKQ